ncbi:hypothetical protein A3J19_03715 [Candidatus Daviesbacteria bacterium RIFCSPLOWO2_02_FULL_41_8]|uniref:DUF5666 domain-containing protein n=3 Tax=Candidatus Daviesiibacteriota TaxID=1752718 RepID=A0A1F5NJW9_9BACT|nr:MAG: hypothetical protein A2871_00555 [Candidatus Daviesbacteria bacterium RIFCSPHIGHO2_01_FULL_41_23]OGE32886.1 MAG: hypothetical protein A3D83_01855 [Candidatus Daviesbacteria bacterium RIFCSPHIGHO2_02_FULL_41_10]OGE62387.1 MAG: hypothetical protein A2967_01045 [Candidatus Daviesbacteria bacterium RIFCSPLOWO2_01_FULL_41_32]OGE77997.1 MAG: hypothetical protein A3J19_03715 [Candidatus Daviesbacteria bacterium RIFCSPLOWO2_02_FULL_41_8]
MKSVKGKALRGKFVILTIILLFILHPSPFTLHPVLAADSSPSADIKSKLEDFKKEIASKAAKLKQEVNRKLKDKAYIGIVKSKSDTSLTLSASSGPKIVSINQDTVFESGVKSKQKFSQKTIAEENYIAALGDIDETGVLTAKKIILLPTTNYQLPKTYFWGQIVSVSDNLITLKDRNLKNIAATLPKDSEVKIKDFVILTGIMNKSDVFAVKFVYTIPQGGILRPKKVVYPAPNGAGATPSAKPATPSAKPKAVTR